MYSYSWSRFGRDAECVVALCLEAAGWDVRMSPASRGPADIIATCNGHKWFIQVKSSLGIPRLKGFEVKRLKELAQRKGGLPVVSTFQPFLSTFTSDKYSVLFYELYSWRVIDPVGFLERGDGGVLQSKIHFSDRV